MLRRVVLVMTGIALATVAALLVLAIGAVIGLSFSPSWGSALGQSLFDGIVALAESPDPQRDVFLGARALWSLGLMICCLPVVVMALIGETAGLRTCGWAVGATAALAVLLPAALAAAAAKPHSPGLFGFGRFGTVLLGFSGGCAGYIYWLIAGKPWINREPPSKRLARR